MTRTSTADRRACRRRVRRCGSGWRAAASPASTAARRRCRRGTACRLSAISKRPGLSLIAPVNAPRSWPKSSVSIRLSEKSAQLTATNGWCRRVLVVMQQVGDHFLAGAALAGDDHAAVAAADDLGEVEDGPHSRAAADHDVVERKWAWRAHADLLRPTWSSFELGDLPPQRPLDADVERHVGARTAGAHAREPARARCCPSRRPARYHRRPPASAVGSDRARTRPRSREIMAPSCYAAAA